MTRGRGTLIPASEMPADWGKQMLRWWLELQPVQRGQNAKALGELLAPNVQMEWSPLAVTRGYKGPFLLLWCIMHWATSGKSMEGFADLVQDMSAVLRVVGEVREAGSGALDAPVADAPVAVGKEQLTEGLGRGARVKKPSKKAVK